MGAKPRFQRVVIAGLGLLGGSLALALKDRKLAAKVVAWGRNAPRLKQAKAAGLVDEASTDVACAKGADLIVLCTPFEQFEGQLTQLAKAAPAGCLVTEVGSVKGPSVERWHKAAGPLRFVASHPMAGGDKTGWKHASPYLFEGAACFLTPLRLSDRRAVLAIGELWQALGMRVSLCSPEEHDRIVGRVSHLPHAAAFALAASQSRLKGLDDFAYAGKGWFDTSRVGGSDADLWADIFLHHPSRMDKSLAGLQAEIKALRGLLKQKRKGPLKAWLAKASGFRRATAQERA